MGKVLFIRGGAIGDFILTLPAIQLLRTTLPDTAVEILGYLPAIELAKAANLADATRSIEYGPLSNFFIPSGLLDPDLMAYFKSFSVVVSYLYDPDGFFRGNMERCGVSTLIEGPHRVETAEDAEPAAAQLAKPLERLALFLEEPFVRLQLKAEHATKARQFLETKKNVSSATKLIALHPGSGSPRKNWSFESWLEVAERLHGKFPGSAFLIVSGEAEDRTITEFLSLMFQRQLPFVHAHHLPLPEISALLSEAAIFLGHDSGISHLAAASGVPCVLAFGPTDPDIWAPKNPGVKTVSAPEGDLSRLTTESVLAEACQILSAAKA